MITFLYSLKEATMEAPVYHYSFTFTVTLSTKRRAFVHRNAVKTPQTESEKF